MYAAASGGTSFLSELTGSVTGERMSFSEGFPNITLIKNLHKLITSYSKFWSNNEIAERFKKNKISSRLRNTLSFGLRSLPSKLYNLEEAEKEKNNLFWSKRNVYNDLNSKVKEILSNIQQNTLPRYNAEMDGEIKRQLEELGYL